MNGASDHWSRARTVLSQRAAEWRTKRRSSDRQRSALSGWFGYATQCGRAPTQRPRRRRQQAVMSCRRAVVVVSPMRWSEPAPLPLSTGYIITTVVSTLWWRHRRRARRHKDRWRQSTRRCSPAPTCRHSIAVRSPRSRSLFRSGAPAIDTATMWRRRRRRFVTSSTRQWRHTRRRPERRRLQKRKSAWSGRWTRSWCGHVVSDAGWRRTIQRCTTRRSRSGWEPTGSCCPTPKSVRSSTKPSGCARCTWRTTRTTSTGRGVRQRPPPQSSRRIATRSLWPLAAAAPATWPDRCRSAPGTPARSTAGHRPTPATRRTVRHTSTCSRTRVTRTCLEHSNPTTTITPMRRSAGTRRPGLWLLSTSWSRSPWRAWMTLRANTVLLPPPDSAPTVCFTAPSRYFRFSTAAANCYLLTVQCHCRISNVTGAQNVCNNITWCATLTDRTTISQRV